MIAMIRMRQRGPTPELLAKELRAAMAEAWKAPGILWHREMRPKHFTHGGAAEYEYKARTPAYVRRKLKKFGHTYPLVWSGESRGLTRVRDVRATSKGVRVVMRANKLNFEPRNWPYPMRYELTRISRVERAILESELDHAVDREINAIKATKETVI